MYSSKLVQTLQAFTPEELEHFYAFLQSPYFFKKAVDPKVIRLFTYLQQHYPFQNTELQKEDVYAIVFPDDPYKLGRLEKTMSFLLNACRQFIVIHFDKASADTAKKDFRLIYFYSSRGLENQFHLAVSKSRRTQEMIKERSKEFYLNQYLIEKEITQYQSYYNPREKDINWPSTLRSLDLFYLLSRLEYAIWLLSQDKHVATQNVEEGLAIFSHLIPLICSSPYAENPQVQVYYQAYLLLQSDDNAFVKLKEILDKHKDDIPIDQLRSLQSLSRNYCIRKSNQGEEKFLLIAFQLYQSHLADCINRFQDKGIFPAMLQNLVLIGLKLKKYDWVYQFLLTYKNKIIGTQYPKEVYNLNLANYHFALKTYDKSLDLLAYNYDDLYYKIASKRLEIKIYFELNSSILVSKIEAFKVYIFRLSKSQLPTVQTEGNNNFIDCLRQIVSSSTLGNAQRVQRLIEKISDQKVLAEKEWLLTTLTRLK